VNEIDDLEKRYGHLFVVAFCLVLLLVVVGFAFGDHGFALRLKSDFWPVDKSTVAPNLLASFIILDVVTILSALFVPVVKRALDRGLSRHTTSLKADNVELLRHLKHIIHHHPDIPEIEAK
jgi:uncharacterized membrane protein